MPPIEDLSQSSAMELLNGVSEDAPDALPEDNDTLVDQDDDDDAPPAKPAKKDKVKAEADDGDESTEIDEDNVEAESSDADDEDDSDPEGATDDVDEAGDEAEQDKQPAIEPPQSLDAEQREKFKKLPREAQQLVADHDRALVADHTRKTQELAERRKLYDAKIDKLGEVKTALEKRVEKWNTVDWAKQAQLLTEEEYDHNRAAMKKDIEAFEKSKAEIAEAEQLKRDEHNKTQWSELNRLAPELAGEAGKAAREEIMNSAIADGYTRDDLAWMTAKEMVIYRDALQWRKYQAEKKNKPKVVVKKNEKSTGRTIKPSSRTNAPSGAVGVATKRFIAKPSQQNAMAALNALGDD